MAASYPTSVKTFSTKATNDVIQAAHVNDLQDEVTAIETGLLNGLQHHLTFLTGGGNITFPATQAASADVNTLDDYEEGSWTPVIGGSGGTSGQTYTTQQGRYIKIGKLVFVWGYMLLSAKGTITSGVEIQGLPFTPETVAGTFVAALIAQFTTATTWVTINSYIPSASVNCPVIGKTAAAASWTQLLTADISNTSDCMFAAVYRAAN